MPFQVSPGINISETDLTHVVPNVATTIGAFAGSFQWGPVLERRTVTTENELVKMFGKPDNDTAEYFFSAANYLSYSNNLLVVRNVLASARNAVVGDSDNGTSILIKNLDHYEGTGFAVDDDQLFIAKYPGLLGNSLKIEACDSAGYATWAYKNYFSQAPGTSTDVGNAGGSNDEMHVIVIDEKGLWTGHANEILELHPFVSKSIDAKRIDGSSNYVETVLKRESEYCWLGNVLQLTALSDGSDSPAGAAKLNTAFNSFSTAGTAYTPGGSLGGSVGSSAVDGNVLTDSEVQAGYALFASADIVDISLLIGGPSSTATSAYCINDIALQRKDCVAFVSPPKSAVVNAGTGTQVGNITSAKTTMNASSNYGVMDSAWKYQYDRYSDVFRYIPMNGDIAGLCARTDYNNDAWWSPAGMGRGAIKNVVKLSWDPTKADRDTMYQASINPMITIPGTGIILWGDKTMQTVPSAFDRINVRRLFIVLEKAISAAARNMMFEFNDEFTRAQFINMVAPFLREVMGRRGITDFKVVCDSSNNTGNVIDTNNFIGDIYVKPNRSINYIQLNFVAARSDVSFSEIGA